MAAPRVHLQIGSAFADLVDEEAIERAVVASFAASGAEPGGELTVVVTDDVQVRRLNRDYRSVDACTDVLAFGNTPGSDAFVAAPEATAYIGDVVISYPRASEQAADYGHTVEEELSVLVVHGVLHLLGYDHEAPEDRDEMWRLQGAALGRLGLCWQP